MNGISFFPLTQQFPMMVWKQLSLFSLFVALIPATVGAQAPQPVVDQAARGKLIGWQTQLKKADQLIKAEKYKQSALIVAEVKRGLTSLPDSDDVAVGRAKARLLLAVRAAKQNLAAHGFHVRSSDPAVEIRNQLRAMRADTSRAFRLLRRKKYAEAAELIEDTESRLTKLPAFDDVNIEKTRDQLTNALARANRQLANVPESERSELRPTEDSSNDSMTPPERLQVSFLRQIAPLLESRCVKCHGGENTRGNLSLATFNSLRKGGGRGLLVEPGQSPDDSLLLGKLRGTADGQQMPLGSDPLSPEQLTLIERWISQGIPFDGGNSNVRFRDLISEREVTALSHAELWAKRTELASTHWDLGMPGVASHQVDTNNFRWIGALSVARLRDFGNRVELLAPKVAELLGLPPNEPNVKGGITLFVLTRRYDYGEFGLMVESRERPKSEFGHWVYRGQDTFATILLTKSEKTSPEVLAAEQLAGLSVAGLAPDWFALGTGRATAARLGPRDERIRRWREELRRHLAGPIDVEDFLKGRLPPDHQALISFAFVDRLMSSPTRFKQLIVLLRRGRTFDGALAQVYRSDPSTLLARLRSSE